MTRGGVRRFAAGLAAATVTLGLFGAALAVAGLVRAHLPLLDGRERILLVLRWAAVAGLAGVVPGMAAGLIAASVARRFLRWAVVGVLVGATVVPVLLAGRRPPPPGTPAVYAPASP